MEAALRQEIVAKLGVAFGGAHDVTPASNQPLHVLLDALEMPSGWEPNPTRTLTIWDDWPTTRPTFNVDPSVRGPRAPQNPSNPYLLGEPWLTWSFSFNWNGDDPVLAVQRWLTIFDNDRPR